MLSPYATYDCLGVSRRLEPQLGPIAPSEIHLFSYLSCLLALYKGRPASDWGYSFVATPTGTPFSYELDQALAQLLAEGVVASVNAFVRSTARAVELYEELDSMSECSWRRRFIQGACDSALALPVGVIRNAVAGEPGLHAAAALETTQMLLYGPSVEMLHSHFAQLSKAIGVDVSDLMVPSVVWLTYLAEVQQREEDAATSP